MALRVMVSDVGAAGELVDQADVARRGRAGAGRARRLRAGPGRRACRPAGRPKIGGPAAETSVQLPSSGPGRLSAASSEPRMRSSTALSAVGSAGASSGASGAIAVQTRAARIGAQAGAPPPRWRRPAPAGGAPRPGAAARPAGPRPAARPCPRSAGSANAATTAAAQATSSGGGAKTRLQIARWVGWIRLLAVEAELGALAAGRLQRRQVVDLVVHAVEDDQAVGARRRHRHREERQERLAARRLARLHLLGQVVDPHHEGGQPGRAPTAAAMPSRSNIAGQVSIIAQSRVVAGAAASARVVGGDVGRRVHLGDQHRVRAGLGGGRQVVGAPGRRRAR